MQGSALIFLTLGFQRVLVALSALYRQQIRAGYQCGLANMAVECTQLDLAKNAMPMLLVGVVALDDGLKLEAFGGVANFFFSQRPDAAIDILARDGRLDFLDANEILLVQRAQALEPHFEFFYVNVELLCLQGQPSEWRDL